MFQGGKKKEKKRKETSSCKQRSQKCTFLCILIASPEAEASPENTFPLEVMLIELFCFSTKQNGFGLDWFLLRYVKFFCRKTFFVPCNYRLGHFLDAGI